MKSICSVTITITFLLFALAGTALAGVSADFTINGTDVNNVLDSSGNMTVKVGDILNLEYTGTSCADIKWFVEHEDGTEEINGNYVELEMEKVGTHTIQMEADGYTNVWSLCFQGWEYDSKTIKVNVVTGNNYPIVLVHGFLGWGRDELNFDKFGINLDTMYYWGQRSGDLEDEMNKRGYDVYTANVSKIGSAWDRACELYTRFAGGTPLKADNCDGLVKLRPGYIEDSEGYLAVYDEEGYDEEGYDEEKKTRRLYFVDYGKHHAKHATDNVESVATEHYRFGNPRFGRPVKNTTGKYLKKYDFPNEPVNLVVHSYGGQTARIMMYLLKNGSEDELKEEYDDGYPRSELFEGGYDNCVRSLTTLSVPHNGTNLTFVADDMLELTKSLFLGLFDIIKFVSNEDITDYADSFYNVDLNQWIYDTYDNFNIEPIGCQNDTYLTDGKLREDLRPDSDDFGTWDLSPCGSAEINKDYPASDETYYFTYNTEQTFKSDGNSVFGKKGWWYFEDYLPRTVADSTTFGLTWNISDGTDGEGDNVMSQPCMLWSDAMGSGTYTTGLSVTEKSLDMIPTDSKEPGYVPFEMVKAVIKDLEKRPSVFKLLPSYLLNSQDLSDAWKFTDDPETYETKEDRLRSKLYEIVPSGNTDSETYDMYISNIIEYGTLQMDLDETWREHDGVVNTKASIAPWGDHFVDGNKSEPESSPAPTPGLAPETGKWLYLDLLHGDHFDVIGGLDFDTDDYSSVFHHEELIIGDNTPKTGFFDFYEAHFNRLWQLPRF